MPPFTDSPHSSLNHSLGGTPDTRLTAFSPEGARVYDNAHSAATPQKNVAPNDPFVSARKPKLSATASAFQPFALRALSTVPVVQAKREPIPGSAEHLVSIIEAAEGPARETIEAEVMSFGMFTRNTLRTRNIRVSSLVNHDVISVIEACIMDIENSGYQFKGTRRIASVDASVFLRLANIEDVHMVHTALQSIGGLSVEYITSSDFGQIVSPQHKGKYSSYEGEVVLRVPFSAKAPTFTKNKFSEMLLDLLVVEGPIVAWRRFPDPGSFHIVVEFADASLASRAISRLNGQPIGNGMHVIELSLHEPDVVGHALQPRFQAPSQTPTRHSGDPFDMANVMGNLSIGGRGMHEGFSPMHPAALPGFVHASPGFVVPMSMYGQPQPNYIHGSQLSMGGFASFSPGGYSYSPQGVPGMTYGSPQDVRHFHGNFSPSPARDGHTNRRHHQQYKALTPGRYRSHNSSPGHMNHHHNHVDVDRIRAGSDVRTTVMLRNIPNKVDQQMLKSIIDESSFGRYDFMYLRIDFSNNCNVGYAFINFVDPLDIVTFVETRANKPWDSFKSDKIAEVSYATIQGRDCLIQKFRNSSVMLEPSHYRPKLFFTLHDGNRVGEEDDFPESDNASKLKRSCENAEHVGLFAPNAGAHVRDEQRRRRSQFDRGTTLAAREEAFEDWDNNYAGYLHYQ